MLRLGAEVRLQLRFGAAAVVVEARVLGSRIVDVIRDDIYETRLCFEPNDPIESRTIESIIQGLKDLQERLWIQNAEGYVREEPMPEEGPFRSFIRVTKTPLGWHRVRTTNPEQPPDGLTLPPSTIPWEIELICDSYDAFNQEWKKLLRAMATLACGREIPRRERRKIR